MKIAIIGAKGMLGRELCHVLGSQHDILAWDLAEIDITDRERTLTALQAERPDLIVNSAAFVDVERCETEPDTAWRINAVGAQNLALAAAKIGSALLYISTDYVFSGDTAADYDEVAQTDPINHYGRSKLAGERMSLQLCPRTYALRTAWLFGHAPGNYVARVLNAAEKEGVVRMPVDQLESPTYTGDLAQAILRLIATEAYGLYNLTSIEGCTRAGFAQFVLKATGRSERVEIIETTPPRKAQRPRRTVLDCRLFQLVTGHTLPHWQQGVEAYLARKSDE